MIAELKKLSTTIQIPIGDRRFPFYRDPRQHPIFTRPTVVLASATPKIFKNTHVNVVRKRITKKKTALKKKLGLVGLITAGATIASAVAGAIKRRRDAKKLGCRRGVPQATQRNSSVEKKKLGLIGLITAGAAIAGAVRAGIAARRARRSRE